MFMKNFQLLTMWHAKLGICWKILPIFFPKLFFSKFFFPKIFFQKLFFSKIVFFTIFFPRNALIWWEKIMWHSKLGFCRKNNVWCTKIFIYYTHTLTLHRQLHAGRSSHNHPLCSHHPHLMTFEMGPCCKTDLKNTQHLFYDVKPFGKNINTFKLENNSATYLP